MYINTKLLRSSLFAIAVLAGLVSTLSVYSTNALSLDVVDVDKLLGNTDFQETQKPSAETSTDQPNMTGFDGLDGQSILGITPQESQTMQESNAFNSVKGQDGQNGQNGQNGQDGQDGLARDGQDGESPSIQ